MYTPRYPPSVLRPTVYSVENIPIKLKNMISPIPPTCIPISCVEIIDMKNRNIIMGIAAIIPAIAPVFIPLVLFFSKYPATLPPSIGENGINPNIIEIMPPIAALVIVLSVIIFVL